MLHKFKTTAFLLVLFSSTSIAEEVEFSRSAYDLPNLPFELEVTPFADEYKARYENSYAFEIDPLFELTNILIALDARRNGRNQGNLYLETPYAEAVYEYFTPYLDHPIFAALDELDLTDFNTLIGLRENSTGYEFEGAEIHKIESLGPWWPEARSAGANLFPQYQNLIADFAAASGYWAFYETHNAFYTSQVAEMEQAVPLLAIREWLNREYPVINYNSYRIYISPLIRGQHSASASFSHEFNQNRTVNAGPYYVNDMAVDKDVLLTRQVFTEIDHNYGDLAMIYFIPSVFQAFGNMEVWTENTFGTYGDPASTFAEYHTWGAFLLFAKDHFSEEQYQREVARVITVMEDGRKFIKFGDFYRELKALYENRTEGETIAHLLPRIIEWAQTQSQSS